MLGSSIAILLGKLWEVWKDVFKLALGAAARKMHRDAAGRASPASVPAAGSLSSGGNLKREGKAENTRAFPKRGANFPRWVRAERQEHPALAEEGRRGRPAPGPRTSPSAAHPARPRPLRRGAPAPARTHLHRAGSPRGSSQVIQEEREEKRRDESKILARRSRAVSSRAAAGGARGPAELAGGGGRAAALSGANRACPTAERGTSAAFFPRSISNRSN